MKKIVFAVIWIACFVFLLVPVCNGQVNTPAVLYPTSVPGTCSNPRYVWVSGGSLYYCSGGVPVAAAAGGSYPSAGIGVSTGTSWGPSSFTPYGLNTGIATSADPGTTANVPMVSDGSHGIMPSTGGLAIPGTGALWIGGTEGPKPTAFTCASGSTFEWADSTHPKGFCFNGGTDGWYLTNIDTIPTGSSLDISSVGTGLFGTINANGFFQTNIGNDGSVATVVNETACENSSGNAQQCGVNTKSHVIGVCTSGCGTTGYPKIAVRGNVASLVFDSSSAVTAGHWVVTSATAGLVADTGSATFPTCGNQVVGVAITSGSASTTQGVLIRPDALPVCGTTGQVMQATSGTAIGLATYYAVPPCSTGYSVGGSAIPAGAYAVSATCYNNWAFTYTVSAPVCYSDNNGTSTGSAADSDGNALFTAPITASSSWVSGTISATHYTIAPGKSVTFTFTADGTSTSIKCLMNTSH